MIKNRNRSRFLPVFICLLVVMLFSSYITMNANATGNIQDTPFIYQGSSINAVTDPRPKWDYTSSYAYNSGSDCDIDKVQVYGCVVIDATVISAVDCTAGNPKDLPFGYAKYLPNYVKEYGYGFARLKFTVNSNQPKSLYGLWSPDSV